MKNDLCLCAVLVSLVVSVSWHQSMAQSIDGVYIDTDSSYASISKQPITDGTILIFDIPDVQKFMADNNVLLSDVELRINNINVPEFPAFTSSSDDGMLQFAVAYKSLSTETRKLLYGIKGDATKDVLLGIKLNESKMLTFSQRGTIYFRSIDTWGSFGWLLIVIFFVFFTLMIYKSKSVIKDNLNGLGGDGNQIASYSFSKSQLAFWTYIVVASFIYLWGFTDDLNAINTTGLILLSISVATTSFGVSMDTKDSVAADDSRKASLLAYRQTDGNFFSDILSDENGLSIHRIQAFIFNVIFGIAFAKSVIWDYQMPDFDEVQLGLLGLSNTSYAILKNNENKS